MRKILFLLVALCMVASTAFALGGYPDRGQLRLQSTGLCAGHTHVVTGPCYIYKVSMRVQENTAWVAIADSAGTGANSLLGHISQLFKPGNSAVKADIGEATAGDWRVENFDTPIYCESGVFVAFGATDSSNTDSAAAGKEPAVTILYATE